MGWLTSLGTLLLDLRAVFVAAWSWRAEDAAQRRTSWAYCPECRHDLNGDDKSFQGYDEAGLVVYECSRCTHVSRWDFDPPAPILVED